MIHTIGEAKLQQLNVDEPVQELTTAAGPAYTAILLIPLHHYAHDRRELTNAAQRSETLQAKQAPEGILAAARQDAARIARAVVEQIEWFGAVGREHLRQWALVHQRTDMVSLWETSPH
jgi:hypothetical protein